MPIADRRLVVEQAAQRVFAGAELDARHVAEHGRSPRAAPVLTMMSPNSSSVDQPALGVDRQLERGVGRCRRLRRRTPAATCTFCSRIASHDVAGRQLRVPPALSGSSQTRIA